jgi:uncharacterized protein (TIGR02722 family)
MIRDYVLLLVIPPVVLSCATDAPTVQRVSADTQLDLSGRWNDTDSQMVSAAMIKDCMSFPWSASFSAANPGEKPTVIVGQVLNKSYEHINTETFIKDLERAFIMSGRVRVVSSDQFRNRARGERAQQAEGWTDPKTMASVGNELGANFMLFGEINSILDQAGGQQVVFYQINLELHELTTTEKVWIGDKKIKKMISRARVSWD